METRKVIKFGNSSFVISLPKEWLKKYNLEKGSQVYLKENGNGAIELTAQFKEEEPMQKRIIIKIDGKEIGRIQREIISAYINDYAIIEIDGKTLNKHEQRIREIIKDKLVAIEVLEQTNQKVIMKSFLEYRNISIESVIKRMDILVKSMFYDLKNFDKEELSENIVQRDIDIDRLFFLLQRTIRHTLSILRPTNEEERINLLRLWDLSCCIERIADDIKRTARFLKDITKEKETLTQIIGLVNKLEEDYNQTMKAYYTKDVDLAFTLSCRKGIVAKQCDEVFHMNPGKKGVPLVTETLKDICAFTHRLGRGVYG